MLATKKVTLLLANVHDEERLRLLYSNVELIGNRPNCSEQSLILQGRGQLGSVRPLPLVG